MARSWDAGRKEGRWDREVIPDEELRRINAGIDATMRDVIRDAKYNPNALDMPMVKVVPQGAAPAKEPGVPEWKGLAEPWKSSHPTQDWLRLGSTVAQANLQSAEAALGEEEEPTKG
jgi:hypothetical protein